MAAAQIGRPKLMNFLELVQRLSRESGISQEGPTTVISQTGEYRMLVDWVNDAYMHVLRKQVPWDFMWGVFSFPTVASTSDYAVGTAASLSDYGVLDKDSITIYETSEADETTLTFLEYQVFHQIYDYGEWTDSRPTHYTILPNKQMRLGPTPDKVYTVAGDYRKSRSYLSADASEPVFDEEYHIMIVWKAMMDHADFIEDDYLVNRSAQKYKQLERQLINEHSKNIVLGYEPLA